MGGETVTKVTCPTCAGRGWHDRRCRAGADCADCNATGEIEVPPGGKWQSNVDPSSRWEFDGGRMVPAAEETRED
jgi:hypothetical protein